MLILTNESYVIVIYIIILFLPLIRTGLVAAEAAQSFSESDVCTLNKTDHSLLNFCWHVCGVEDTLMYFLWSCPSVRQSWTDNVGDLSNSVNAEIQPCLAAHILSVKMSTVQHIIIHNITALTMRDMMVTLVHGALVHLILPQF